MAHSLRYAALAALGLAAGSVAFPSTAARADGSGDPKAVSSDDGKYVDAQGQPTFNVKDGRVDYYTFVGYVRYTANCMQCHGPDGLGSTYAPALVTSFQHLGYGDVVGTVAGGKQNVNAAQNLVMPSFGNNKNVMCYIDAIYTYLRARSDGAVGRGRPQEHDDKPAAFTTAENQCMG